MLFGRFQENKGGGKRSEIRKGRKLVQDNGVLSWILLHKETQPITHPCRMFTDTLPKKQCL